MEPFIQRMMERAIAQTEKLNEQLVNAGHDIKKRNPLKGNGAQMTALANEISVKLPKATAAETLIKSSDTFLQLKNDISEDNENNKENDEFGTYNARSKLQRLGKLYSEDNTLESQIHRIEEKFNAEEIDAECKLIKREARLNQFAVLASTINNWEDDLSHSILNSKISIESSPNSDISDISAQNEINQYLDECLDMEATLDEKIETETKSKMTTEADYIQNDESYQETSESDRESTQNSSSGRTSLERTVLNVFNKRSSFNKKGSAGDLNSTVSDISTLDEMDQDLDKYLMEDVKEKDHPILSKINKSIECPLVTCNSFKYTDCRYHSPLKESSKDDDGKCIPLVRTVSAYRREQFQLTKAYSAAKSETRLDPAFDVDKCEDESMLVENKVKKLMDEVIIQNKKIEEASKALNLCKSSIEFNGSSEHVGGEWALLVATRKRQIALNEVQRLKQEGILRPANTESLGVGSGILSISAITLLLKPEYIQHIGLDKYLHCVCLMYHLGEMVSTQAATAEPGDSYIRFTSMLEFDNLPSDFKINVEVYSLQTQQKFLPHGKKYHINHRNVKMINKTPKKKNQFIMPDIQSPAGPHVIKSSAFELSGTATITINNVNCEQLVLYEVSPHAPLEGLLRMRVSRKLSVSVEHRGFLTLFEDISNLGAWRRRWCWLKDAKLYFWVHPEDEHKKSPISYIDLEDVFTKNVQFVNREKCARPFTFVLETCRPAQPGDDNSLIMKTNGIETTIQHFLLADTKEEGLQWMSKLNKTLSLIRAWGLFKNPV